jgi:hypothetical protein
VLALLRLLGNRLGCGSISLGSRLSGLRLVLL